MTHRFSIMLLVAIVCFAMVKPKKDPVVIPVPKGWPKPTYDFKKNPLNEATIELGRQLFYDTVLSRNNQVSCANCHLQQTAFTHIDHALSHGIEDRIGNRNSPALVNLAWGKLFMWDGAVNHLDVQALAPIENHLEMDEKIAHVVQKLQSSKTYRSRFYKAFGDSTVTGERTLKSISQFLLNRSKRAMNCLKNIALLATRNPYLRTVYLKTTVLFPIQRSMILDEWALPTGVPTHSNLKYPHFEILNDRLHTCTMVDSEICKWCYFITATEFMPRPRFLRNLRMRLR